jgi:MoxR-like ATPase
MSFTSIEELESGLHGAGYLPDRGLATALYLSLALGKPLLLEGEDGGGQGSLADPRRPPYQAPVL